MWLVWLRPLGPSWACRVKGCSPGRSPVKVWCIGADCMTRSLANWAAEGALIDSPGGGPFLREVDGVRSGPPPRTWSCGLANSLSLALPGLFPFLASKFCLASIICLCWSRTLRLRCNCSCIPGSLVWKPGERHASPTSCITSPADSRDVKGADGRAVCGPRVLAILDVRSNFLGRGREDCIAGEPGSFLTWIMGGAPFLSLCRRTVSVLFSLGDEMVGTHALGEVLPAVVERSTDVLLCPDAGEREPLLRARFAVGSVVVVGVPAGALFEWAVVANGLGET